MKRSIFGTVTSRTFSLKSMKNRQWQDFEKKTSPSLKNYTALDISHNQLGQTNTTARQKREHVARFSDGSSIQHLNMSHNELWQSFNDINQWGTFTESLLHSFPNILSLDLSGNDFYNLYLFQNALKSPLAFISQFTKLNTLNLSGNDFFQPDANSDVWKNLFQGIQNHETLKTLILCDNHLDQVSTDIYKSLEGFLPGITELQVSRDEIIQMSPKKQEALRAMVPNAKLVIVDKENNHSVISYLNHAFHASKSSP